jgi:hypothetical protein
MSINDSDFAPSSDPASEEPVKETVEFEVSDLRDTAKETLGSYMLGVTEKNYYGPSEPVELLSPDDPDLLGTPSVPDISGVDDGFFQEVTAAAQAYYQTITDGSVPNAEGGGALGPLTDFLDKTGQSEGHALLAKVAGDAWADAFISTENTADAGAAVRDKISPILAYNRFNPAGTPEATNSPYIEDGLYSDGIYSLQTKVGRYDPEATKVAVDELAKIAFSLALTATGAGEDHREPDSADSTNAIGQGILNQLQLSKVLAVDLETKYAAGFPGGKDGTPSLDITLKATEEDGDDGGKLIGGIGQRRKGKTTEDMVARNSKSYGQLNSYLEPFDGPLPVGMIVLAVLAAVAVLVAGIVLAAILTLIFLLFPPGEEEQPPEPMPMGAAAGQPDHGKFNVGKWLMSMLRVPILRSGRSFIVCMLFGVLQFYFRIIDAVSSGYFIVVSRACIRDLEQIGEAMAEADFSNIVGGLESIFVVLDAFATSTTFQFLNRMAMLGDIVCMSGGLLGKGEMAFSPWPQGAAAQPDNIKPVLKSLNEKSKTMISSDTPDYRLAWRFGSLPSRYLLPGNLLSVNSALGLNDAYGAVGRMPYGFDENGNPTQKFGASKKGAVGDPEKTTPAVLGGRFDAATRMAFEDTLDAYYIPFYLQDLRTNEFLAMHTFVDGLQDSFTPEWNSVDGFGRMDSIMIYKRTKRNMGLSFWMVATNPEDLDELYWGINKLVTMVYPQWSKGSMRMDDKKNTFIMPFTQIPTASPVVRLRLGDLWSSNYSLQNLGRQFGLGSDSFTFEGKVQFGDAARDSSGVTRSEQEADMNAILSKLDDDLKTTTIGEPDAAEALLQNAAALVGLTTGCSQGYDIGTKVYVKPSKYRKAVHDGVCSYKSGMGKYKLEPKANETALAATVAGYQVNPIVPSTEEETKAGAPKMKPTKKTKVRYVVFMDDPTLHAKIQEGKPDATASDVGLVCNHDDLAPNWEWFTFSAINDTIGTPATGIPNPLAPPADPTLFQASEDMANFWSTKDDTKEGNSIVRAFQESGGQGIAGVITQLDFDWNLAPWAEDAGRRAPTYVKVTMGFSPIHDIPLGMDSEGGFRAPAYNVGTIVRGLFGSAPDPTAWTNRLAAIAQAVKARVEAAPGPTAETAPNPTDPPAG